MFKNINLVYFKAFFQKVFYLSFLFFLMPKSVLAEDGLASGQWSSIQNPIRFGSIGGLVEALFDIVFIIAVPVGAVFLIYSGFMFVTAQGDKEKLENAKNGFTNAVIGLAIILGAWVLAQAIEGTIELIRN